MTDKRIIFNYDGKLQVLCPAPQYVAELMNGGLSEDEAVNFIGDKDIPANATNRNMVELKDIPPRSNPAKTLNHRDAFEWNAQAKKVIVNPAKIKPL